MILFTKGTELTIFGQLNILMMFSINLNLKTFRLLNCLHMIFSTLYTTLPHHLIKNKLIDLINRTLFGRIPNIWLATNIVLFSLLMYTIITIYVCVKKSVMSLFIFWIIFFIRFRTKLYVFRCELIVLLLLQICFFFVMREIS